MQTAIRRKTKPKHHRRNEITPIHDDLRCEYVSTMMKSVAKNTHNGVQSLKIDLRSNCIMLTGFCESYYIKQLAQQAIMDMVIDMEIVNDIVVV